MPPITRSQTVSVTRDPNPTIAKFVDEVKQKKSQLKPAVTRPMKIRRSKLPRVGLNNVNNRVLAPPPPVVDPLRVHIENIRAQARTLRHVDVRVDNGVIIID